MNAARPFLGLFVVAACLGPVLSAIASDELKFISQWTSVSVDTLKQYENLTSSDSLIRALTDLVFKQQHLSWPVVTKLHKLRTSSNFISEDNPNPALLNQTDPSLLVYPAWQLLKAVNVSRDLNVTLPVLKSVASRHMTYGQASVLVDAYKQKQNGTEIPEGYLFTMPSDAMLSDAAATIDLSSLLGSADKMYPSQRHALYKKLFKTSVSDFVANATRLDVAEEMLEFMSPGVFRSSLPEIRDKLNKFQDKDLVNVVYYPTPLLNAWQEDIQSSNGLLAMNANLAIRGLTCASLQNISTTSVLDVTSAYNAHVMDQHPHRLKTMSLSLRHCFVEAVKRYLISKVANVTDFDTDMANAMTVDDVKKIGGPILSGFRIRDIQHIKDRNVKKEVFRAIGLVPLAELMPLVHPVKLQNLTLQAIDGQTTLDYGDLTLLGTLAFFLPAEKWALATPLAIRTFVDTTLNLPHHKCICLPKANAEAFKSAMILAYGQPSSWSPTTLATLDELIIALDPSSIDSLSTRSIVSALPYILLNKTYHDNHYDFFPGFVGRVAFGEACQSWLDSDIDAEYFRTNDDKVSRKFLLASQLVVNIALSDPASRIQRQLMTSSYYFDQLLTTLQQKTTDIVKDRYTSGKMTVEQLQVVKSSLDELDNKTTTNVLQTLGLKNQPEDIQKYIRTGLSNGNVTSDQVQSIMNFAKTSQKAYISKMQQTLNLTARDLGVSQADFCLFFDIAVCPPETPLPGPPAPPLPALNVNVDAWDKVVPLFDLRSADVLPFTVSCHGILAAASAASALRASDLDSWTPKELLNCIDVIGSIDWPTATKLEVFKLIKSKMELPKGGPMMILQGKLIEAAAIVDPSSLSFNLSTSIEPLSALAEYTLPKDTVIAVADKIVAENSFGSVLDESTVFHLESLKQILCGFSVDLVQSLIKSATDKRSLLHCLGSIRTCDSRRILETLANQAKIEIPRPWKTSDALSLGIILAGLSPTEFAALDNVTLAGVTPAAVGHLTPDHFRSLSAEKLSAIPVDSMTVLRIGQLPAEGSSVLDSSQVEALLSTTDPNMPLAKMIRSYQATIPETTPAPTPATRMEASAVVKSSATSSTSNLSVVSAAAFALLASCVRGA